RGWWGCSRGRPTCLISPRSRLSWPRPRQRCASALCRSSAARRDAFGVDAFGHSSDGENDLTCRASLQLELHELDPGGPDIADCARHAWLLPKKFSELETHAAVRLTGHALGDFAAIHDDPDPGCLWGDRR